MQIPSLSPARPDFLSSSTRPRAQLDPADLAACRSALRHGSRSFLAASLMLPAGVRDAACALYAFCRMADDAVDEGPVDSRRAVAQLRARLARVYDASLPLESLVSPADRALASVVARFDLPRELPEALIDGFEWDAEGRHYETVEELYDYAARVAGTVGAMMALLMGVRSPVAVARACELGVAMQLSNIARDVGADAAMGRLYLPRQWMREAGIDPDAWLAEPRFTPALGQVIERLLDAAAPLYERVGAGVAQLPLACRPGINAARFLYEDIGNKVRASGFDSVSSRAVVPGRRKLWLLMRALVAVKPSSASLALPVLTANQFLVSAVSSANPVGAIPSHGVANRVIWVLELFDRLERQRDASAARMSARAWTEPG